MGTVASAVGPLTALRLTYFTRRVRRNAVRHIRKIEPTRQDEARAVVVAKACRPPLVAHVSFLLRFGRWNRDLLAPYGL
jgi:hypothetical protein